MAHWLEICQFVLNQPFVVFHQILPVDLARFLVKCLSQKFVLVFFVDKWRWDLAVLAQFLPSEYDPSLRIDNVPVRIYQIAALVHPALPQIGQIDPVSQKYEVSRIVQLEFSHDIPQLEVRNLRNPLSRQPLMVLVH